MGNYLIHSLFLFLHIMEKKIVFTFKGVQKKYKFASRGRGKKMVNLVSLDQTELVFISFG